MSNYFLYRPMKIEVCKRLLIGALLFFGFVPIVEAQNVNFYGKVSGRDSGLPIKGADVFIRNSSVTVKTDANGAFYIKNLSPGKYTLVAFYLGMKIQSEDVVAESGDYQVNFVLGAIEKQLDAVKIMSEAEETNGITRLQSVEGAAIYEAKKTEVIVLKDLTANLATNNSRQVYAKVPGLNIWESDGAGLQLGLGARGLDPNRTSNFNVRQNGYDISADALGYPESYYTPPLEALERIEVVRGAASLQYGTQFGGLLNFILKKGPRDKPIELTSRQTVGSFGFFNSFNSVGGTKGKFNYYTFFQHKQGNGWRPNSDFDLNMAYADVSYSPTDRFTVNFQYTHMYYLAQQPGGLTDARFEEDPRQSIRERNWFRVNWNLAALNLDYKLSDRLKLNVRNFMLIGGRDALGNLGRIDRTDEGGERDLFVDDFENFGNETRVIYNYSTFSNPSVLLIGTRYYRGFTDRKQGNGPDGKQDDFRFLRPDNLEGSDFDFPSRNFSIFAENIFNLTPKFSVTPGVRFEYIKTSAEGYFQNEILVPNPETGIAEQSFFKVDEVKNNSRSFVFAGLGLSYKQSDALELYGNFSQNYRAINFNDIRVVNPNLVVDENISDEKGFNLDVGFRGNKFDLLNFDVSFFYLKYNDRIGSILQRDDSFRIFRFRTNVADSRHIGAEIFAELNLLRLLKPTENRSKLNLYTNLAIIDAQYINSDETTIEGNEVELVPPLNLKAGLAYSNKDFRVTYQYAFTQEHYSDATNAEITPSAVEGLIPSYQIMDLSFSYRYKFFTFETGINNLLDEAYFTRRATGYPGPGIIPADGRSFYFTLGLKI
ncbi:TonB-dependent receptor [Fulvivirgaceae bacterium BMA12]|uniref:TonB-dependent receptor n=1 Tax=Agaribacillus aureus TaxID=3051825 RepID=A0ABT8L1E3_9BACT|nr:TonB-dependent receptor [Fulvivirgaceae bacterium BMA12]